jgi:hypothetical protein
MDKPTKEIKYEDDLLYMKCGQTVIILGKINTRKGNLTRTQKLKAVQYNGEWVVI